jgi:hypothetical protein
VSDIPASPPFLRSALGLPAGSVRALLALCVLLYLWGLALTSGFRFEGNVVKAYGPLTQAGATTSFASMMLTMLLVVCQFFVAHGSTLGKKVSGKSPLYIPTTIIHALIVVAYFGLVYWAVMNWTGDVKFDPPNMVDVMVTMGVVLAAFLLGHASTRVMRFLSGGRLPFWFQDVQAWFGLMAFVLLLWVLLARGAINTTVANQSSQLTLHFTEPALAALVAFYYGARAA